MKYHDPTDPQSLPRGGLDLTTAHTLCPPGCHGQVASVKAESKSVTWMPRRPGVPNLWERVKQEVKKGCPVYFEFLIETQYLVHNSKYTK